MNKSPAQAELGRATLGDGVGNPSEAKNIKTKSPASQAGLDTIASRYATFQAES